MHTANGYSKGTATGRPTPEGPALPSVEFSRERLKEVLSELEVPFDPSVIEWRVTNTTKDKKRGQVIPYAGQRVYTDRLNALFSPAGWTRKYAVHTSANFQRGKDQKTVAKVFVTCDLTIFGVGSHSATGEEWTDDENAGTSAEAQAFKRACSCFGLGRYLYYFTETWVDLDDRKRPKTTPTLGGWATPDGWRQGLRPQRAENPQTSKPVTTAKTAPDNKGSQKRSAEQGGCSKLVRQIEALAEPLGNGIYRGLLKTAARAWNPCQIQDAALLQRVLAIMQAAERGLHRLTAALEKTGPGTLTAILHSVNLKSLDHVNNLETLQKIVLAIEAKASGQA